MAKSKKVMTVLGPVAPKDLGITLTHEHLLLDMSLVGPHDGPSEVTRRAMAEQKLEMRHLGVLRRLGASNYDNNRFDDVDLAAQELMEFKKMGGKSLVELSCVGLGRDVVGLRSIAALTGMNIVAPCGHYKGQGHHPSLAKRSIDDIAAEYTKELTEGIGNTGIRAGVIGEIGAGQLLYALPATQMDMRKEKGLGPTEEKALRAAGRVNRDIGAPISVHIYNFRPNRLAHEVLDVLKEEGTDLTKVVISHLDSRPDVDYIVSIADRGAYVEFDTFGIEFYIDGLMSQWARDIERIALVQEMIKRGYTKQVLLSQDVCWKMLLVEYGGWGYAHISRNIEPRMRHAGISEEDIRIMRVENPARWLAY